jgi:hypothetical protein
MRVQIPNPHISHQAEIAPGVFFEWCYGERAFKISVLNSHPATLDSYLEAHIQLAYHWLRSTPWLSFQDVSCPEFVATPQSRACMEEALNLVTELGLHGHVVLLIANNFQGAVYQGFVKATAGHTTHIERHVFCKTYEAQNKFAALIQSSYAQKAF